MAEKRERKTEVCEGEESEMPPQASCRVAGLELILHRKDNTCHFLSFILRIFHSLLLLHIQLANEGLQRADKKTQAFGRGQQLEQRAREKRAALP